MKTVAQARTAFRRPAGRTPKKAFLNNAVRLGICGVRR